MKKILISTCLSITITLSAQFGGLNNIKNKAKETTTKEEKKVDAKKPEGTSDPLKNSPIASVAGEGKTDGITSTVHQKNVGKIVFSKTAEGIAYKKEKESDLSNKFNFSEEVFLRVYMDNSITNYVQKLLPSVDKKTITKNAQYKIHFYLNGIEENVGTIGITDFSDENKDFYTTFKGSLYSKAIETPLLRNPYYVFINQLGTKLTNGDHKIKITITPYIKEPQEVEGPVIATGELTITVDDKSFNPEDPDWCIKKAAMVDANLQANIIKTYKEKGGNSLVKYARITSDSWLIVRNNITSAILRREINVVVVSVNKSGQCVYENFPIVQQYVGGKFQDALQGFGGTTTESSLNCRCVK